MTGAQAAGYVTLSALAIGGWAFLGYGARKLFDRVTRHHGRQR